MSLRIFGYFCLAVISSAILLAAGTLAWFAADRKLPVEIVSTDVLTPVVKPGGKLIVQTRIRYLRECNTHVDRAIYDSHTHRRFLPDIDYERPPQGLGEFTYTSEIDVPDFFGSGPAEFRAVPIYACNPLQRYYWPITRDDIVVPFEVESPQ
ncbi:hypothetical protein [Methylobacterium durans]|uniref:Uncharacterized protein n=1 Tax=Methylobacterium durans TaxID=2202825 RepID=A0A2U8WD14_9HYPH|nr:hypothetical protein [Methylobacterium durans]AWN43186.1 hypothetical protein DK389_25165 [Methylobacterium durans]